VSPPPQVDPTGGEALWRHLHALTRPRWQQRLHGQPHVAFEYEWREGTLTIQVWVPDQVPPGMVERAVEAAWPGARTTSTKHMPFEVPDGWVVEGGRLTLARPAWMPLRTRFDADPLRGLFTAAAQSPIAAVRVLARPCGAHANQRLHQAARQLRAGHPTSTASRALDLFTPGAPTRRPSGDPAVSAEVKDALAKAAQPLWDIELRFLVATEDDDLPDPVAACRGRAHAVASSFAVFHDRNRLARRHLADPAAMFAAHEMPSRGSVVSAGELAAMAHLPTDPHTAGLAIAGARPVPPPPAVSADPRVGKLLGDSDTAGSRPVVLRREDSRFHLHVMGATGSGKSTLLTRLILDDVDAGRGVVVIDPKGDLVTDVLARLGPGKRRAAVVMDPDAAAQPALNMLEVPDGVGPHVVVDHLVGIFSRVFESSWGPRLEDVFRSACLTLLARPGATLSSVPQLLSGRLDWRAFLPRNAPEELFGFWAWFEHLTDSQRAQVTGPLLYKLRAFLLRPFARQIVDASRSSVNMSDILDGGLLLARLPKGVVGEDTARLLGSFVVAKTWQAATARAGVPQHQRRDAALVVDECQNFLALPRSFDEILAEARGYRLSMVLAHQHLAQLPRDLRDAISANARNKVFFSMSPEDAAVLQRHTQPALGDHDLANLGAYQAAVRLTVDGEDQRAFTIRTRPAPTAPR
jgi:hypothetical protein